MVRIDMLLDYQRSVRTLLRQNVLISPNATWLSETEATTSTRLHVERMTPSWIDG